MHPLCNINPVHIMKSERLDSLVYLLVFGWISQSMSTHIPIEWPHNIAIMNVREEINATSLQAIKNNHTAGRHIHFFHIIKLLLIEFCPVVNKSDSVRMKRFQLGLKWFLHCFFPCLTLVSGNISSVLIIPLQRIRFNFNTILSMAVQNVHQKSGPLRSDKGVLSPKSEGISTQRD